MKKITSSAILALVLVTTSTEATSWYVGVEQSLSYKVKNTAEVGSYSKSNSESPTITSIKVGAITGGDKKAGNRYEFLYNFGDKSANPVGGLQGEDVMSLNFNYHFTLPMISPKEEILPYLRLGGSYIMSSDKYRDISTGEKANYSAVGALVGVGTYYKVTDNINVSAGFDYGYRLWEDLTYYNYYRGSQTIESEDKFSKLYIGVDYLF